MNFKVLEFYLEFMNKGFNYIKSSDINVKLTEDEFSNCLSIINFVRDQFKAISYAMGISFTYN